MSFEEMALWLRLQLTEGVGRSTARQLLVAFGLPQQVFSQSVRALREVVTERQAQALHATPPELDATARATWDWLQADPGHRRLLALGDAAYPSPLLDIEDPPLVLYAMGTPLAWTARMVRSVAIVGSRNPTPQGLENATQFARALAQAGLTIVSGMATGIDTAAHTGALQGAEPGQLATIAVVGTGLDRVYPKTNLALARQIAHNGLLLSEFPIGTPPLAANFPQRNRIISGLSLGTLVVEAALQSGSLITARMAAEQGKDVFSIPGSIHSTQARGCHALIKQGAKLVESANDVLDELRSAPSPQGLAPLHADPDLLEHIGADLSPHTGLLACMGFDPAGLDILQTRSGLDTPQLQAELMALELQGRVARLPGGLYQRLAGI
ncbi:MAG: DNA-processing protein DprA [Betaproteobacteria bacterium]